MTYFRVFSLILALILLSACTKAGEPLINGNADQQAQINEILPLENSDNPDIADDKDSVADDQVDEGVAENEIISEDEEVKEEDSEARGLPIYFKHQLDFVSQAPHGVWDEPYKEACEEASMIMAVAHVKKEPVTLRSMSQGIISLVKWEEDKGYGVDVNAQQVADIMKEYFGVTAVIDQDVSVENIKQQLVSGAVVVIPAAGRELNNPNFQRPGPIYHMLVIIGYDENKKEFITHDPGTRNGGNFRYKYDVLINAIHDLDQSGGVTEDNIQKGRKVMLIVK
jgi:hypothetical protein